MRIGGRLKCSYGWMGGAQTCRYNWTLVNCKIATGEFDYGAVNVDGSEIFSKLIMEIWMFH